MSRARLEPIRSPRSRIVPPASSSSGPLALSTHKKRPCALTSFGQERRRSFVSLVHDRVDETRTDKVATIAYPASCQLLVRTSTAVLIPSPDLARGPRSVTSVDGRAVASDSIVPGEIRTDKVTTIALQASCQLLVGSSSAVHIPTPVLAHGPRSVSSVDGRAVAVSDTIVRARLEPTMSRARASLIAAHNASL